MNVNESKYVVLLLGAGASAAYGPPVMRDFMRRARRRYFELDSAGELRSGPPGELFSDLKQHYVRTLNFCLECESASARLHRNWNNIEELYTQADLRRLIGGSKETEAHWLCDSIAWVIADIYRFSNMHSPPLDPAIKRLKAEGLTPVIVTTNYDLIPEIALGQGNYYYPGFSIGSETPTTSSVRSMSSIGAEPTLLTEPGIPIIKLHGSVNWFRAGENTVCHSNPHQLLDRPYKNEGFTIWSPFFALSEFREQAKTMYPRFRDEFAPEIIPPMLGKASSRPIIRAQWQAAIEAFAGARQIWIVDYSFPTTDAFMQRLLHEGLTPKANRDFEKLSIVDIEPRSKWEVRLESLLTRSMQAEQFRFFEMSASYLWAWLGEAHSLADWGWKAASAEQRYATDVRDGKIFTHGYQ
jgi:SIR2-like domain